MFFKKKNDLFYYPGSEIPLNTMDDQYRCVDGVTFKAIQTARTRMAVLTACFVLAFFVIITKLFWVTIVCYDGRSSRPGSFKQTFSFIRKDFVDRNGTVIATSIPAYHLIARPREIKGNIEEVVQKIVQAYPDISYDKLKYDLTVDGKVKTIKRNLTPKERNKLYWLGYYFLQETASEKRAYLQGGLFSHILGMADIDNIGIAGLEKSLETQITQEPVQLSLDVTVQEMTRSVLSAGIEKYQADGGLAIVMDVRNAEVLATVSLPDFNPNLPIENPNPNGFNKTVSGVYEFGSVFKLFNTAMALEYGDIKPTDKFDTSEPVVIGRKEITDYRGPERVITVPEVLMHSSNIGTVKIAQRSGWQKQKEFLNQFNFFNRLPLNLPERAMTLYPTEDKWAEITQANVAFGYGISVTPMHLIAGVAALVNGGIYRVPTFVKGANNTPIERQVLSEKTSDIMRHMMWAVTNWDVRSTSVEAQYAIGGKTGSANLLEDGKYQQGRLRTTFVGVFPMNNPAYAVLVTLEDPKKLKETWMFNTAGWNSKKIGIDLIAKIAPYLGITPVEKWDQPAYIQQAIESSLSFKKR